MEVFFTNHHPIGLNLIKYLSPMDYISLSRSISAIIRRTPSIYPTAVNFLFSKISEALKRRIGEKVGTILATNLTGANYLTGGFLLAALNDDEIREEQDIDLICNRAMYETLKPYLTDEEDFYAEGYQNEGLTLEIYTRFTSEYRCKIQFILVHELYEHYIDRFDLDFCKNVANGSRFYVTNAETVFKRHCIFSVVNYVMRYVHYEEDAPTRYTSLNAEDEVNLNRCEKVQKRIVKYRARGYDVILRDNSTEDIIKCLSWPNAETRRVRTIARIWSKLK
jgi:hypothetical protein